MKCIEIGEFMALVFEEDGTPMATMYAREEDTLVDELEELAVSMGCTYVVLEAVCTSCNVVVH